MSDEILPAGGLLVGRVQMPGFAFPRVVTVRGGRGIDITSKDAPTVRDICEKPDPAGYVAAAPSQSSSALSTEVFLYLGLPAVILVLQGITIFFLKIDKSMPEMHGDLAARRTASASAAN